MLLEVIPMAGSTVRYLGIDTTVWAKIRTALETDFKAAPSETSIVDKIPDIKQVENESLIQYFTKALRLIDKFKAEIDPMTLAILDFILPENLIENSQLCHKKPTQLWIMCSWKSWRP